MTVESTTSSASFLYTGPGAYSYAFKAYLNSDIVVEYISSTGVFSTLTESTHYTLVRDVDDVGGTVTTSYAPTTGTLRISRVLPFTQNVDLENQGPLDMDSLEKALDRNVMLLQQMNSTISGDVTASEWLGLWVTGTAYGIRDIVQAPDGNWYTCLTAHTAAASFSTDLSAGYWLLVIDVSSVTDLPTVQAEDTTMVVTYGSTTIDLKVGEVATANIANLAVTGAKIAAGTITQDKISGGAVVPVGSVIASSSATVPTGYLECDGAAVSRSTYSSLFSVISDDYGAGNGSTTFNLPDYRGQFLRGWAHGQTTDPDKATRTDRGDGTAGDYVGTKQADGFKAHVHYKGSNGDGSGTASQTFSSATAGDDLNTGSTGGNETRPTNVNVLFCIKY
jgi:microcystin-dependent protein